MTSLTSEQFRSELTMTIYGIDPDTLIVETVTVSRGGTISLTKAGKTNPSSYRIKGGKPARGEVSRVFGLTDLVLISAGAARMVGDIEHPLVTVLQKTAARRRLLREEDTRRAITHNREHFPDHQTISQHEHTRTGAGVGGAQGVHPLAGSAIAVASRERAEADDTDGADD
jgi:hypothetical protein